MSETIHLKLPYLDAAQAQKHVTHNEALLLLDALVHCAVEDRGLTAPPPSPVEGARYLVAAEASGAWSGRDGALAIWQDGAWTFQAPVAGMLLFVKSEGVLLLHDGAGFRAPLARTPLLGINMLANETRRLSVASESTLLDHAGGDHRMTINKASEADTASVIFQDGYSGRAEIGLAGSDAFSLKVSADGTAWQEAIAVDPATGHVGIGATPDERLRINGGNLRVGWHSISAWETAGGAAMEIGIYGNGDRAAYFDFHASDAPAQADYSARFIRWDGEDGPFGIYNMGDGGIEFVSLGTGTMRFHTDNAARMTITAEGKIGVASETPTADLQVDGTVRVGRFAKAALPTASSVGAGTLAYVTDASGGAALACSDGAEWRRVADGMAV